MGGSSKSQTVGYNYSMGAHIVLCRGPIDKITQITTQNKSAWSGNQVGSGRISINQPNLFGGATSQGGIVGDLDVMVGDLTQGQNDYLVSQLGSTYLPSFRGVVSIVLRRMMLGMNPYIQPFEYDLSRIHTRQIEGLSQWYDEKSEIAAPSINGIWSYKVIDAALDTTAYQDPNLIIDGTWTTGLAQLEVPFTPSGTPTGWNPATSEDTPSTIWYRVDFGILVAQDITITLTALFSGQIWINGNVLSVVSGQVYIPASALIAGQNVLAMKFGAGILGIPGGYTWAINLSGSGNSTVYPYIASYGANVGIGTGYLADGNSGIYYDPSSVATSSDFTPTDYPIPDADLQRTQFWDTPGYGAHTYGFPINGKWNPPTPDDFNIINFAFAQSNSGDMNGAHIIRECLTDPDVGKGLSDSDLDNDSFTAAADQLYSEGMGLSVFWDWSGGTADSIIEMVCKHINAAVYRDRTTGLYVLKLIRNDYDVSTLLTLNTSNITKRISYACPAFRDLTNSVTVNYFDGVTRKDATLTVQDIALSSMQGKLNAASVDYKGFYNANIASIAAQRDLNTLSAPLRSCQIIATLSASTLNQGSVFKLTHSDYDMTDVVMRVTEIDFGDGKDNSVTITCVEDIFSLPTAQFIQPDQPIWINPSQPPTPLTERLIFEAPYLELVQILGQDAVDATLTAHPEVGYVAAAGGRPTYGTKGQFWDDLGSGYSQVSSFDFCPIATLDQDISYLDSTFEIINGKDLSQVSLGKWCQIDDEIMVVTAISDTSISVKRGCLDTIPALHSAGATLFFWDDYAYGDDTQLVIGNTPKVKILSVTNSGVLDITRAQEDQITIVGRASKPYNTANVKINGSYYPISVHGVDPLAITWSNRNRLAQTGGTIYGFTDANITPETGVTYTINLKDNTGGVFSSATAVTGSAWSTTLVDDTHANITVEITALRADIPSFQSYEIQVERHGWGLNFDNNWDGQ
jgi:hypothetical protein